MQAAPSPVPQSFQAVVNAIRTFSFSTPVRKTLQLDANNACNLDPTLIKNSRHTHLLPTLTLSLSHFSFSHFHPLTSLYLPFTLTVYPLAGLTPHFHSLTPIPLPGIFRVHLGLPVPLRLHLVQPGRRSAQRVATAQRRALQE